MYIKSVNLIYTKLPIILVVYNLLYESLNCLKIPEIMVMHEV